VPRPCTVCAHPEREAIDAALVAGASASEVATNRDVSIRAVQRHKAAHLPAVMVQAAAAAEVVRADDLLQQARDLQAKALSILSQAEAAGDLRTAVAANREARGCLELLARLLGEMPENPSVNVILAPEWLEVRRAMLLALEPFPLARAAVSERLLELELAT
jgi:hypothetical protein